MPAIVDRELYASQIAMLEKKARLAGYGKLPNISGICVGGCVRAAGTEQPGRFRHQAHAHIDVKNQSHPGWICILSQKMTRIITPTGRPTVLLGHEYVHLLVNAGHTAVWRDAMRRMGYKAQADEYEERAARNRRAD